MMTRTTEFDQKHLDREDHWIAVSDLMAGLMMVFLLIAIVYMVQVEAEADRIEVEADRVEAVKERIREIAVIYQELKQQLYEDLYGEFREDLPKWGAELDRDSLTVRFEDPDLLFEEGSSELRPRFRQILDDFFPRYANILNSDTYQQDIEEVRIEGHTSSVWRTTTSKEDSYFLNMELSQARTRSTLRYVLSLPRVRDDLAWLRRHLTANGLSFSRLILTPDNAEDPIASRRVEFRVKTNAEEQIARILEVSTE
jgi:outer membrane protein OmpA-like peptidoglycan-associated protein